MVKISIIVPVYNSEKYLENCINSILNQTIQDFELILVNDGSNDNSGDICNEYSKVDRRVKVIHQENLGQASARNNGLKIAKGNYIGFVDSDDWIDIDMYEKLYESCIMNNSEIAIIGLKEVNEKGICLNEYIPYEINFKEILKRAYPCNKLFKKSLFKNNDLYFASGRYYEDLELIPKLYINANKVSNVNEAKYNYLKRNGSTTSTRDFKVIDNLWAYVRIKDYLILENKFEEYKYEFNLAVSFFKKFYSNELYDYPTMFLLKNRKIIINYFNEIGRLSIIEQTKFIIRHITYVLKKMVFSFKKDLKLLLNLNIGE